MFEFLKFILLLNNIIIIWGSEPDELNTKVITTKSFVFWPNATVPFYVSPDHFDKEQTIAIMTGLSNFAFKTCIKFAPVLASPKQNEHVMVFVNPDGLKRCKFETSGHSVYEPHMVLLGYDCLQSPQLDMMIMKALGFPFEHNRLSRDLYIEVLLENVEPGAVELFTKDIGLPIELRAQPYDVNSVMHFGQRDFSKNGHRTILFKNVNIHQNRVGLSSTDLKKIELVYGPECQKRDRQEKIELCQSYPGAARRKREVEKIVTNTTLKNLRVNRNITPPPTIEEEKEEGVENDLENKLSASLTELGVDDEIQAVLDHVHKVTAKAHKVAKEKYCNKTTDIVQFNKTERINQASVLGIVSILAEYTQTMLERTLSNLTVFCASPDAAQTYQRQKCNWRFDSRCPVSYKSTKSGPVRYSTNHRPYIVQSTKHRGQAASYSYDKVAWRSRNDSSETTTPQIKSRRKREAPEAKKTSVSKDKLQKEKLITKEKIKVKENVSKETTKGIVKRRFFERRSYKARKPGDETNLDWNGSQISQEADVKDTLEKKLYHRQTTTVKRSVYAEKEVNQQENVPEEETAEVEEDTTTMKPKKRLIHKTSQGKIKIKDTFELMEDKKKLQEEQLEKKTIESKLMKKRTRHDVPITVHMSKLNREFYNERRWPEGIIRYVITPLPGYDLDEMRTRLKEVANILHKKTCVKFEEVTQEEADNFEDYLVLDNSPDYITGRVGGRQQFGCLELFEGGQHRQHAAMMVMSMLGFYFEVARHDRDRHIRVHMRHVRPDKLHHFEKIRDEATLNLSYDYKSATHPAWQFWRKIGKTGISTVATYKGTDPDGSIMRALGQHEQLLSDTDIIKINTVYGIECFTDPPEVRAEYHEKH